MNLVVHVAPLLPPQNSGVGDYAMLVGRRMEEIGGVRCAYVVAGQIAFDETGDSPHVRNVSGRCDPQALWQAVAELKAAEQKHSTAAAQRNVTSRTDGGVSVVLNYSGYGYEPNGCPSWLVDALRSRPAWVERVVTYFHELYATGLPWQRAFWYSSAQRRITAQIARASDAIITNCAEFARWLEVQSGRPSGSVLSLPVPSNVGEPEDLPAFDSRCRRAVAFGGVRSKRFALNDDAPRIARFLQRLGITELHDIGSQCPIDRRAFEGAGVAVHELGYLEASEVSRALCGSRIGFLDYPLRAVAKSGVFAAYAAHGVVPLLRDTDTRSFDRVTIGDQALALPTADGLAPSCAQLQRLSEAVRTWYSIGSSKRHAETLLQQISPASKLSNAQHRVSTSVVDQPAQAK